MVILPVSAPGLEYWLVGALHLLSIYNLIVAES